MSFLVRLYEKVKETLRNNRTSSAVLISVDLVAVRLLFLQICLQTISHCKAIRVSQGT